MISIVGTLEAGEAQGAQRAIRVRMQGANFGNLMFAVSFVISVTVGIAIAVVFDGVIGMPSLFWPALVVAIILVMLVLNRISRKWALKRYRRNMQARSMPTRFRYSLSLANEELILETQWLRKIAPWSSVTEIIRSGRYWIFLVGFESWFAPSRFFSGDEEERIFIATAVTHLSGDARERSKDAVAFAGPTAAGAL
jgi:hypothetical protein